MSNTYKLSLPSTLFRVILISLLIMKGSLYTTMTPESRGVLIANILIFLWILPFITMKIAQAALSHKIQPFIALNYNKIMNTIFKVACSLFCIIALTTS